jgi:hypothetical protein
VWVCTTQSYYGPGAEPYYHRLAQAQFKGIVQRDVTGVEIGLKKSMLISYITGKNSFLNLKGPHHERSKKPVSAS